MRNPAPTILLVEDDNDLRHQFRRALVFAGYRTQDAEDGFHACDVLDTHPPDLVVLDLPLPVASGHVILQEVVSQAHTRQIPVVVVIDLRGEYGDFGDDCVLRKPVSPDELVLAVRRCLASNRGPERLQKP